MSENCIFCKIVAGQATAAIVLQDSEVTVFRDQRPAAPIHLLIVPNKHITSFNRIGEEDAGLLAHMFFVARKLAEQNNVSQDGYRLVINTGPDAGQTVFHLHLHLLAGQRLSGLGH